jgi:predicted phosphodiesterase
MIVQPELGLGVLGDDGPVLIFGGPYSNLAATCAMLERARELAIPADRVICTGDVVAYCAEPEATCQAIMDSGIRVVMGNCEESLGAGLDDCGCGFGEDMLCSALSQRWYRYARERVSEHSRAWMVSLPRLIRFELGGLRVCVVHGAADQINRFVFASTSATLKQEQLQATDSQVMIGGHCGIPFGQRLDSGYWLNAGVIGLPANDGLQVGWYMLLKVVEGAVVASWHALEYDAETSYRNMLAAGLDDYAPGLLSGLWPSLDVLPGPERDQAGKPLSLMPMHLQPDSDGCPGG